MSMTDEREEYANQVYVYGSVEEQNIPAQKQCLNNERVVPRATEHELYSLQWTVKNGASVRDVEKCDS